MSDPKSGRELRRTTKNSKNATSLEDQNRILQEVLEASKTQQSTNNNDTQNAVSVKEKASASGSASSSDGQVKSVVGDSIINNNSNKRAADDRTEGPPAKKDRKEDGSKGPHRPNKGNLILEYPDYDAHPLVGTGGNRLNREREDVNLVNAGNRSTSDDVLEHEGPGRHRQEHELSLEVEQELDREEHELSDYSDDDYEGTGECSLAAEPYYGHTSGGIHTQTQ